MTCGCWREQFYIPCFITTFLFQLILFRHLHTPLFSQNWGEKSAGALDQTAATVLVTGLPWLIYKYWWLPMDKKNCSFFLESWKGKTIENWACSLYYTCVTEICWSHGNEGIGVGGGLAVTLYAAAGLASGNSSLPLPTGSPVLHPPRSDSNSIRKKST